MNNLNIKERLEQMHDIASELLNQARDAAPAPDILRLRSMAEDITAEILKMQMLRHETDRIVTGPMSIPGPAGLRKKDESVIPESESDVKTSVFVPPSNTKTQNPFYVPFREIAPRLKMLNDLDAGNYNVFNSDGWFYVCNVSNAFMVLPEDGGKIRSLAIFGSKDNDCVCAFLEGMVLGFNTARAPHTLRDRDEYQTPGYQRVKRFMELAGQDMPSSPTIPDLDTRKFRAKMHIEEELELIKGLGLKVVFTGKNGCVVDEDSIEIVEDPTIKPDIVEVIDGCEDSRVVHTGTMIAFGVTDVETSREVDENNLAKFGPGGYRRDDGKWIKPPDHQPPNIQGIIVRQIQRAKELQQKRVIPC